MSNEKGIALPENWGSDTLSNFIDGFIKNILVTFNNEKPEYSKLAQIDAVFQKISSNLHNPQSFLEALLLVRCHSAFRAATELTMGRQTGEAFAAIRLILEYSGYACLIKSNPDLAQVFLEKNESPAIKARFRKEFQQAPVRDAISAKDRVLADKFQTLYERCLDFGAHPNDAVVSANITMKKEGGSVNYFVDQLSGKDIVVKHAVKTLCQAAVCALHIFYHIFPARFDLLNLRDEVISLRANL